MGGEKVYLKEASSRLRNPSASSARAKPNLWKLDKGTREEAICLGLVGGVTCHDGGNECLPKKIREMKYSQEGQRYGNPLGTNRGYACET